MSVGIKGGSGVISPNGIDYKDRLIGVCYNTKEVKFHGDLKKLGFVEVLGLDGEQRIYEVNETEKLDFEEWLLKWSNNDRVYGNEEIVLRGEFPNYRLELKEVISGERG